MSEDSLNEIRDFLEQIAIDLRAIVRVIHDIHSPTTTDFYKNIIDKPPISEGRRRKGAGKEEGGRTKYGCRLPDDFDIDSEMLTWATNTTGRSHGWVISQTENFVDYWRAASGRTATKRDWIAAWRVWIRKANDVETPKYR